jgi:hypothetical protein
MTYGVMFGCDESLSEEVITRLTSSDETVFHPMILPAMFAEMERNRRIPLVRESSSALAQRLFESRVLDSSDTDQGAVQDSDNSIILWGKVSDLRNGMVSFKRQMEKMVEHIDELEDTLFSPSRDRASCTANVHANSLVEHGKSLRNSGIRIKTRLYELIDEYDEYIRLCATIMDGMVLSTQLVSTGMPFSGDLWESLVLTILL